MMDELLEIENLLSADSKNWISSLLPSFSLREAAADIAAGKFDLGAEKIFSNLFNLFFGEIALSLKTLALLLATGVILGMLDNLRSAFASDAVHKAARLAAAAVLTAVALEAFSSARETALTALEDLNTIMNTVLPLSISLMISSANACLGSAVHPVIYFMCSVLSAAVKNVVLPLAMFSMALYILSGFAPEMGISPLADLMRRAGKYLMGFIMMLFTGVLSVSRFAGASFDSLSARGLKFAVSTAIPVVGSSVADAMNSVAGASALLKNSVGVLGSVLIIAVALLPVIKIGALATVFRLGGALMGTMGDEKTALAVSEMAQSMEMLLAAVTSVGVMMVIGVSALMG